MATLIVPACGEGTRFSTAGFKVPKPFIEVNGKMLIEHAVDPFLPHVKRVILLMREHTLNRWETDPQVKAFFDRCSAEVIGYRDYLEGAALTVLGALAQLSDQDPVLIANSDQGFANPPEFLLEGETSDGTIYTFEHSGNDTRWSYARTAPSDLYRVTEVAEKRVISTHATCGLYYFRRWATLRTAICAMVAEGERYNGEFYLAPVYNYLIRAGLIVTREDVADWGFYSLGTPELVQEYVGRVRL